jgi:hypothetical protein
MKLSRYILLLLIGTFFYTASAFAQPGFKVDIEKPKPYQERKLKAEKTGEGKLKGTKLVLQNLTTRFNYVFNAKNKLNDVLLKAKEQHKDDYAELLSFYPYDLNATAADSTQLDSVIYKARTGIVNHDLRNEWLDELYLLWAQSWHMEKKFDSASLMLQFINYAYAPQYDEGFYKAIGTHNEGDRELSIMTKEEKKFLHSNTFGRNNAFIWQIRTRIEMGDLTGAGSLITTLRRDPNFPPRLSNDLDEVEAYWNYKLKRWDSAAVHLLAALDGDYPKLEKARWRYLAAQLMEKAGKPDEAAKLFEQVADGTPDPVMDVYARLNIVRLSKGGEDAVDRNVAELLKMARKDKYEDYRDIIYYMAAQMELERNNIAAASELLLKGAKFNNGNQAARNRAFLQLADVLYQQKKYSQSASFYDSVQVNDLAEADAQRVADRKTGLQKVVANSEVVYRQDSLQRIAALPQAERDAAVKAMAKKLRKQQGLKEEATVSSGGNLPLNSNNPPADLFSSQQKGEWYFYNSNAKAQGAAQYKAVWGSRPNVDNWRRFAAVSQQLINQPDKTVDVPDPNGSKQQAGAGTAGNDFSFEGLSHRLPTTPEALKASKDSIRNALFNLGLAFLNDLEDYPSAISTFEELRRRFPDAEKMDEVLFNLYYAYTKVGDASAAAGVKKLLNEKYSSSRYAAIASTGKDPEAKTEAKAEATKAYEHVYNLFIEGQFAEAERAKHIADSTYKTNFWEPQLLYIESVYYIKQREDSIAKNVLATIIRQNTNKALTAKAQTMIDVLSRRKQIEEELTNLQITRPSENDTAASQPVAYQKPVGQKDTIAKKPVVTPPKDTVAVVKKPEEKPKLDTVAIARAAQKKLRDSLALADAAAKRRQDSIAKAERDAQLLSKLAEKRLKDSLDKLKADSIALAKQAAAKAAKDSLARKALAEQQRRDSIAKVAAAKLQARKDSLALVKAMQDQARDSMALRRYLEKRRTDSLARVASDSIALVKQKAAKAHADSLAAKALAEQQRRDSIALAKKQAAQARLDSLARKALADKQHKDSLAQVKAARDQAVKDSLALAKSLREQARKDSIALAKENARIRDSIAKRNALTSPEGYFYNPAEAHYAVVVLNKVDPIFVSEAKNAFDRYNKENYYNQPLDVQILNLTADTRLLLISGLPTAAAATDYVTKAKAIAATEIIPWLTGNKYTFSIISAPNLSILKTKADMSGYQRFLEQHLPGKF